MRPCARVSGHVAFDLGDEKLPAEMRVQARSPSVGSFGWPASVVVKPDGTFSLSRMCGESIVGVPGVPRSIRQAVSYKGKDVTDLPTAFADTPNPRDLQILLTNKGAEISGRVTDAKGVVSRARIVVFSADPRRWPSLALPFQDAAADAQGRFSVKPLGAGKYLMVAVDARTNAFALSPFDSSGFAKLATIATPVDILENEVRKVSLTLAKLPQ